MTRHPTPGGVFILGHPNESGHLPKPLQQLLHEVNGNRKAFIRRHFSAQRVTEYFEALE